MQIITWTPTNLSSSAKISLYYVDNSGTPHTINSIPLASTADFYIWTVAPGAGQYKVEVVAGGTNPAVYDLSNSYFSITALSQPTQCNSLNQCVIAGGGQACTNDGDCIIDTNETRAAASKQIILGNCYVTAQTCIASDLKSLTICVENINSGAAQVIKMTQPIYCSGNDCAFAISNPYPIAIIGTTAGAGIFRNQRVGGVTPILLVSDSPGLCISDLILEDVPDTYCTKVYDPFGFLVEGYDCQSLATFQRVRNVTINRTSFNKAKHIGAEFAGSYNINVQNSLFYKSSLFGLHFIETPENLNYDIRVENNTFTDNRLNAILFAGKSQNPQGNTIIGNTFQHNHHTEVYGYPGGQLLIEQHTNNTLIKNNKIFDGHLDVVSPDGICGIEFSIADIVNVVIDSNTIHDNSSAGIFKNQGNTGVSNNKIINNNLYNNSMGDIVFDSGAEIYGNYSMYIPPAPIIVTSPNGGEQRKIGLASISDALNQIAQLLKAMMGQ